MKFVDYIVDVLIQNGISTGFCVNGGAIAPLIDKLTYCSHFKLIPCLHEASAAYAAEAFTKASGLPSVVILTSGPGGTNALTGLNCCWCDSTPVLFISGQVSSNHLIGDLSIRQRGVQETDIISLVKSITKYSTRIRSLSNINSIQTAINSLTHHRNGPSWVDICVDMFNKETKFFDEPITQTETKKLYSSALEFTKFYKNHIFSKPLVVAGCGISDSKELVSLLNRLDIPIVSTWASKYLLSNSSLYSGSLGLFGERSANYLIQQADVVFVIGSSLNICHTGYDSSAFAENAHVLHFDFDKDELKKDNYHANYHPFLVDICDHSFFSAISEAFAFLKPSSEWIDLCKRKSKFRAVDERLNKRVENNYVNSFQLLDIINNISGNFNVVTDMGTSFTCGNQVLAQSKDRRLITSWGHAPMGWGISGAIGASLADISKTTLCITGDGGLAMSLQDLITHQSLKLPIITILLDNDGYLTMKHTTQLSFRRFSACGPEHGICNPEYETLCKSIGIEYRRINSIDSFKAKILPVLTQSIESPLFVHIKMNPIQPLVPRLANYIDEQGVVFKYPLSNMFPHDCKEFQEL